MVCTPETTTGYSVLRTCYGQVCAAPVAAFKLNVSANVGYQLVSPVPCPPELIEAAANSTVAAMEQQPGVSKVEIVSTNCTATPAAAGGNGRRHLLQVGYY